MKTTTKMIVSELTGPWVSCSTPGELTSGEIVTHLNNSVREYEFYLDTHGQVCYRTSGRVYVRYEPTE